MKLNVYLPDEIGDRAKAADPELNLSRLLRAAVEAELDRRERVSTLLTDSVEHELRLSNSEGVPYTGVLTGKLLAVDQKHENLFVYLTADERLLVYDEAEEALEQVDDLDELRAWLNDDHLYISVCGALGKAARVEV